jgi:rhomboid protease GluP
MAGRNNIGAILCPNCQRLISADTEQCIHCGMKNPNLWGLTRIMRKLFGGKLSLVPVVVATCVAFYVISLLLDPKAIFQGSGFFTFLSPSMPSMYRLGMTGTVAIAEGRWWSLITANYLHGGILHIFFNMMVTRQLGPLVEELFGVARFVIIFAVSGVSGFWLSVIFGVPFTVGASCSLFGFMGALIYYGRKRGGTFGTAIYRQIGQWALVLFVIGFLMPGINNYGHAGGFIGGYVVAALFGFKEIKRETATHALAAAGCLVLTVLAFLLMIISG